MGQVCIGGGAGFIGSHLAKKLKADNWYVVCADWKENEFMRPEVRCGMYGIPVYLVWRTWYGTVWYGTVRYGAINYNVG